MEPASNAPVPPRFATGPAIPHSAPKYAAKVENPARLSYEQRQDIERLRARARAHQSSYLSSRHAPLPSQLPSVPELLDQLAHNVESARYSRSVPNTPLPPDEPSELAAQGFDWRAVADRAVAALASGKRRPLPLANDPQAREIPGLDLIARLHHLDLSKAANESQPMPEVTDFIAEGSSGSADVAAQPASQDTLGHEDPAVDVKNGHEEIRRDEISHDQSKNGYTEIGYSEIGHTEDTHPKAQQEQLGEQLAEQPDTPSQVDIEGSISENTSQAFSETLDLAQQSTAQAQDPSQDQAVEENQLTTPEEPSKQGTETAQQDSTPEIPEFENLEVLDELTGIGSEIDIDDLFADSSTQPAADSAPKTDIGDGSENIADIELDQFDMGTENIGVDIAANEKDSPEIPQPDADSDGIDLQLDPLGDGLELEIDDLGQDSLLSLDVEDATSQGNGVPPAPEAEDYSSETEADGQETEDTSSITASDLDNSLEQGSDTETDIDTTLTGDTAAESASYVEEEFFDNVDQYQEEYQEDQQTKPSFWKRLFGRA